MFPKDKKIEQYIHNLLTDGQSLSKRLKNYQVRDSQLPEDTARWIYITIDEILPLMPTEHPDYKELNKIKTLYKNSKRILLSSVNDHVDKVIHNLKILRDCVLAASNANYKDIPPKNLAHIGYNQLKRSLNCVKKERFIEYLKGKENGRTSKTAMLNIYGRICFWVHSMIKLNKPEDCLALSACARAILELNIDLNLINTSVISNDAEKFFAFPQVAKWYSANNTATLRKKFGLTTSNKPAAEDQYLDDPANSKKNIQTLSTKLWGTTIKGKLVKPKHWTNKTLEQRVKLLDNQILDMYLSLYYFCNWHIHSMYSDFINNLENIHRLNWHLYSLTSKMFIESTCLLNKKINVFSKDILDPLIESISNENFKDFFGEMVKAGPKTT